MQAAVLQYHRYHRHPHGGVGRLRLPDDRGSASRGWPVVNGRMLVVFVKGTGHVLSAVTVATAPTRPLTSKDLVGDALPLWSVPGVPSTPGWSFGVPAEALDVAMIDPKQELLDSPFDWKIGSDNQPAQLQRIGSASPTIEKIEKPAG